MHVYFLKNTWTQILINPDLTAKFSLCSPLHITWLQVFFHCFALFRLCYGPKSTWISAFLGGGGCSSSICFHCATYSPWTTAPVHQRLCSAEVRDWSLAYSTSQPLWLLFYPNHRTWAFMANLFPPLPPLPLGAISVLSQPLPQCVKVTSVPKGIKLLKCWKGAKASSGQVINHTVRGMRVESKLHTKIQPGESQADYHQTFPKDVLCWLNHNELIRWVSTRYIYKGNGPLRRTWFKSDMRPVPQLPNALTI